MQIQQAVEQIPQAIVVRNLIKSFSGSDQACIEVFNGISFEVQSGEIIGVFGPSGCGKTTLLRIVTGICSYEGEVLLFGKPARAQKGIVAYVPQHAELLNWRTLRQNALLGYQIINSRNRKDDERVSKRADALFERFRLGNSAHKYPRQCSGGERQRAALIRALLTPANVIALDEPADAIDHISRSRIYETLLNIMEEARARNEKITVVMISHDPEELLFLCDKILVIPARAKPLNSIITVPFSRPRHSDIKFTGEFVDMKRFLWNSIV